MSDDVRIDWRAEYEGAVAERNGLIVELQQVRAALAEALSPDTEWTRDTWVRMLAASGDLGSGQAFGGGLQKLVDGKLGESTRKRTKKT